MPRKSKPLPNYHLIVLSTRLFFVKFERDRNTRI